MIRQYGELFSVAKTEVDDIVALREMLAISFIP